eukprot:scaffold38301_cov55-Attheya_sp.AAC.2
MELWPTFPDDGSLSTMWEVEVLMALSSSTCPPQCAYTNSRGPLEYRGGGAGPQWQHSTGYPWIAMTFA